MEPERSLWKPRRRKPEENPRGVVTTALGFIQPIESGDEESDSESRAEAPHRLNPIPTKKKADTNMDKNTETQQDIELVDIEDLRTAFGGEDLAVKPETETNLVNKPTTMCSGWT